jgi:hypothetical protein
MTADLSIGQELERQSVLPMECTIPPEMTVEEWRRLRSARPRAAKRRQTRVDESAGTWTARLGAAA